MSKSGVLNKLSNILKEKRMLVAGITLMGASTALKTNANENEVTTPNLQEFAQQTQQTDTAPYSSDALLYKTYVEEHGLSKEDIETAVKQVRYGEATPQQTVIANLYNTAIDRHENNIVYLERNDMGKKASSSLKMKMLEDRVSELENIYGDQNDYTYKQEPAKTTSTAPENEKIQNLLEQDLNGDLNDSYEITEGITLDDVGGLANYVSIEAQARQDVLEEGLIKRYEYIFEAQAEMEEVENQIQSENKFKNPFRNL